LLSLKPDHHTSNERSNRLITHFFDFLAAAFTDFTFLVALFKLVFAAENLAFREAFYPEVAA